MRPRKKAEKSSNKYKEGYSEETLNFVKGLLQYIPKGTHIYMAQHSPIRISWSGNGKGDIQGAGDMIALLDGYPTDILSGHTHIMQTRPISASITDHNAAAIGGAWWATDWCRDGSPRGYEIITSTGGKIDWKWHNLDYSDNFQVSFMGMDKAPLHRNNIVANVWQGSGDSRLANYYITDSDSKLSYYQRMDSKTIESRLLNWLDTVSVKASINIEKVSRTLLCLHANINTWHYDADQYDIEHIVSRQKLKKSNAYIDGFIPGGTIGNLMYLKPKTNRGKQGNNLYAVEDNEGVSFIKNYLKKMNYPDRTTIDTAEEQLENGHYDLVKQLIQNRAKDIIKSISEEISTL